MEARNDVKRKFNHSKCVNDVSLGNDDLIKQSHLLEEYRKVHF